MKPLAERMRPEVLGDFVGQAHLLGEAGALTAILASRTLPSLIFWGPPGVGKTTLARLVAGQLDKPFYFLSAVHAGVKEVRAYIEQAKKSDMLTTDGALLFIDEIHRFAKNQQDALLGAVEEGVITLIGATTENPSFEVIAPLLSRCQTYILQPLTAKQLLAIVDRALREDALLAERTVQLKETNMLLRLSGGDARKLLNVLELVVNSQAEGEIIVTDALISTLSQERLTYYDKEGEQHYDLISAMIKSVRGSDPNAAVYYLARMLEGGEPESFIARRLVILASEDIGNANPQALLMATSCMQALQWIGMPEGRIILAQVVTYLACSPKSNASYVAIETALATSRKRGALPVPLAIRNAPTPLMKEIGYGTDYQYAHDHENEFADMEFLPDAIAGTRFYDPKQSRWEEAARAFLKVRWKDKYGY